jgi:hypothetical protein
MTIFAFRIAIVLFAIVLGAQSVWLLSAEFLRPKIDRLPIDPASIEAAANQRHAASVAASIGFIRGDLWADAAFAYSDLLSTRAPPDNNLRDALKSARAYLLNALKDAPHDSGAWLLLAELSSRYPSADLNMIAALKMSYYTGPSDKRLIPIRLTTAVRSDFSNDFEMRQFVTRDLRILLSQQQKSVLIAAYNAASAAGKAFIKHAIGEIDQSALTWLHGPEQPQPSK